MPTYRVSYCYRECGSIMVFGDTPEDAERFVELELAMNGVDKLSEHDTYSTSHREYGVDDVEFIEGGV